jgi:hypothetical protein
MDEEGDAHSEPAVDPAVVQPVPAVPTPDQLAVPGGSGGGAVTAVQPVLEDPWPHIGAFYKYEKADFAKRTVTYVCLQCRPKKVSISAHISSLFNLKSHIKRAHSTKSQEFEDVVSLGSRRGRHERDRKENIVVNFFLNFLRKD